MISGYSGRTDEGQASSYGQLDKNIDELDSGVNSLVSCISKDVLAPSQCRASASENMYPPQLVLSGDVLPLPITDIRLPELEAWNPDDELSVRLKAQLYAVAYLAV